MINGPQNNAGSAYSNFSNEALQKQVMGQRAAQLDCVAGAISSAPRECATAELVQALHQLAARLAEASSRQERITDRLLGPLPEACSNSAPTPSRYSGFMGEIEGVLGSVGFSLGNLERGLSRLETFSG